MSKTKRIIGIITFIPLAVVMLVLGIIWAMIVSEEDLKKLYGVE